MPSRHIMVRWILLALPGVVFMSCSDHRTAVAVSTLVTEHGKLHEAAYSAALSARFPEGTPIADIRRYVVSNGGRCDEVQPAQLWCEIPLRGGICWAELAGIEVAVKDGRVESIRAVIGGVGC